MSEVTKTEKGHFRRNWFFYFLILAALIGVGYFALTKNFALDRQAKNFADEKIMIFAQAQEAAQKNSERDLELMMKAFVWAVRGEVMRGNNEQVDLYFTQLVKSEKVIEVTLVDNEGAILLSSNKKNQGSKLAAGYADKVLNIEDTSIIDFKDKQIVSAPVLSLDSRIGTLVVVCKKDIFQLEEKVNLTEYK